MFHVSPHPELHPIFETLGYAIGFGAYKAARRRAGDVLEDRQRWSLIAAAMVGALIGSRVLGLGAVQVQTTVSDWGTRFIVVAGLLNVIAAVDAHNLRTGRKPL